jgi:hypothetical protein
MVSAGADLTTSREWARDRSLRTRSTPPTGFRRPPCPCRRPEARKEQPAEEIPLPAGRGRGSSHGNEVPENSGDRRHTSTPKQLVTERTESTMRLAACPRTGDRFSAQPRPTCGSRAVDGPAERHYGHLRGGVLRVRHPTVPSNLPYTARQSPMWTKLALALSAR